MSLVSLINKTKKFLASKRKFISRRRLNLRRSRKISRGGRR